MDKITEEILKRLDSAGEITRAAIEEIIPIASRRVLIEGFLSLFVSMIFLAGVIGIFWALYRVYKETDFDINAESDSFFMGTALGICMAVLFFIPFYSFFESAMLNIFATEWQVIEMILESIGG